MNDARERSSRPSGDQHDRQRGVTPVLMIVEDDGSTLALLHDVATDAGWSPQGYTRLADFHAAIERVTPDLVILDDDLPDGRGGDVARDMRADSRLADVPILVCTAAHPMRQAEITGWAPVISKPFDLGEIERFLDAARERGRRHDEAAG